MDIIFNFLVLLKSRGQQTFPVKDQKTNPLVFVGHMVYVTTTQLCHHSMRATVDNMYTDESGSIPIKLYFWTLKFLISRAFHMSRNIILLTFF